MISWGLVSALTAAIPILSRHIGLDHEYTFYAVRVLLGIAEAGFFPGIIFYLTLWFPAVYRARIIGYFMAAIPLSSVIGAPVSGAILAWMRGVGGIAGWQWLYLLEAAPAFLLGFVVLAFLTDRPADATWLTAEQRDWLVERQAAEERQRLAAERSSIGQTLGNPRIWGLALVYFGAVACNYGISFWMPTIVKAFGLGFTATGLVTAIPYIVGTAGMIWYGRRSDASKERKYHAAIALLIAAVGIAAAALIADPVLKIAALSVGAFGTFAVLPVFWTLPTAFLSGPSAAAGIALINALGNLSGFAGPFAMGWIRDATGQFSDGLLLIAACAVVAMAIVLALGHDISLERIPRDQAAGRRRQEKARRPLTPAT
jgi:MFS family permease